MVVVKLGGSLHASADLPVWLKVFAEQTHTALVIVPGGGPFAERVRVIDQQFSLPNDSSHAMAVLGMQQYAHMLHGLQPVLNFISTIDEMKLKKSAKHSMLWLPYTEVMNTNELQRDWQTTSDTIALWLAIKLQATRLFLIKSADIAKQPSQEMRYDDIVDQHFLPLCAEYPGVVEFMHATQAHLFMDRLQS